MDAADLELQDRKMTGLGRRLATRLIEMGHAAEVAREAARGDWSCARVWADHLAARHRPAEAVEVLAPYAATGWWNAVKAMAEMLEKAGRADEAIALVRPYATPDRAVPLAFFARLLARHGRADEGFALLTPHLGEWFLATALVDVAESAGRDEEAAELLTGQIEVGVRARRGGMVILLVAAATTGRRRTARRGDRAGARPS